MTTDVHIALLQIKDEIESFVHWIRGEGSQRIMEIGSHQGGTALHFCEVAKDLTLSLDLPGGAGGGLKRDECEQRNTMIRNIYPQFRGVLGNSHDEQTLAEVEAVLGERKLDGLFIDGDHTYVGVKQDFEMYSPLVRRGGWVAFHDINDTEIHRNVGCDVARFWNELEGDKREFNIYAPWGGIGVYVKGDYCSGRDCSCPDCYTGGEL